MNLDKFIVVFQEAKDDLDPKIIKEKNFLFTIGSWLNSAVLRIEKPHWANDHDERPHTGAAIFFSIWVNEESVSKKRLLYNIHALRLRKLKGYSLTSREFAAEFRSKFKKLSSSWPNVSVDFGPLTLMEGWMNFEGADLKKDVLLLLGLFFDMEAIIDEVLIKYQK